MTLYFEDSYGERRPIAECESITEAGKHITAFIEEANKKNKIPFKSYYTRIWKDGDETWFDVGSHTDFFILKGEKEHAEEAEQ